MAGFASFDSNYYYIGACNLEYPKKYEVFLNNPSIAVDDLRKAFEEERREVLKVYECRGKSFTYDISVVASLYSSTNHIDGSKFEPIAEKLVLQTYLPDFNYVITLRANHINLTVNSGKYLRYPERGSNLEYL